MSHNGQGVAPLLINQPLTDTDIFTLQDAFLDNGFHYIQVKDVDAGRALIETFLYSLGTYHFIGCLTVAQQALNSTITDVQLELFGAHTYGKRCGDLEEFFIEQFYYDFLWIEACHELQATAWYDAFKQKIVELNLNQHIPIIILSYEEK